MKKVNKRKGKVNNWENISMLISSSWRRNVLKKLDNPKTPTQLRKELNMNPAHVTRTIKQLEKHGMIKSLTPNQRQGKLFIITKQGKELLKKAEKIMKGNSN